MDLSGNDKLKHSWEIDEITENLIITLKDDSDVVIDTIEIEGDRARSFMAAMSEITRVFFPDVDNDDFIAHKTTFNKDDGEGETEFLV